MQVYNKYISSYKIYHCESYTAFFISITSSQHNIQHTSFAYISLRSVCNLSISVLYRSAIYYCQSYTALYWSAISISAPIQICKKNRVYFKKNLGFTSKFTHMINAYIWDQCILSFKACSTGRSSTSRRNLYHQAASKYQRITTVGASFQAAYNSYISANISDSTSFQAQAPVFSHQITSLYLYKARNHRSSLHADFSSSEYTDRYYNAASMQSPTQLFNAVSSTQSL